MFSTVCVCVIYVKAQRDHTERMHASETWIEPFKRLHIQYVGGEEAVRLHLRSLIQI